jgi:ABC-type antimicrobial peptide transport system permease subunit
MVLHQGTWPIVAGFIPGLTLATGAARILASFLFDAPPLDPVVVLSAAVLFLSLALAAAFLPVRRAVRISALEARRCD